MLAITTDVSLILLVISGLGAVARLLSGPTYPDRILALDTISVHSMAIITVYALKQGERLYTDAVLVIAVLSFLATVVAAKFITGGVIIDRNRD